MPRRKLTSRELALKMVVVSKKDDSWSIMVANRARKEEVTRMSFMDFLERKEAMGIARLIRRAIVDALEQANDVNFQPTESTHDDAWFASPSVVERRRPTGGWSR